MKYRLFVWAFACMALLSACSIETSDNGDLDGFWRLEQVDSVGRGAVTDYSGQGIYWSFQHQLVQLSDQHGLNIIYRLAVADGTLSLDRPYVFDRTEGDTPLTDVDVLRPFGVNALQEQFRIVTLGSESIVLESSVLRLHFSKY